MDVSKNIGARGAETPLRFRFFVVEGDKCNNPGRIRTIQMDTNGGGQPWLRPVWREVQGGVKAELQEIHIAPEMKKLGAFFLLDAYDEDPNPKIREQGKAIFLEHDRLKTAGEVVKPFEIAHAEWLPTKVRELQAKTKKSSVPWEPPAFDSKAAKDGK